MWKYSLQKIMVYSSICYMYGIAYSQPLNAPEVEISSSLTNLRVIEQKLNILSSTQNEFGYGTQNFTAKLALENGLKFFYQKDFLSCIREVNYFLYLSQVPIDKLHLSAYRVLGLSYDFIGEKKLAIRNYLNYLGAFTTTHERNFNEFVEVVRMLVTNFSHVEDQQFKELKKTISALSIMDLNQQTNSQLFLLIGKTIHRFGDISLAQQFINNIEQKGENNSQKAQALYLKSLALIASKKWEAAENMLTDALTLGDSVELETKNAIKMALARIAIQQRHFKSALKIYSSIDDESIHKKESLYESIFAYVYNDQIKEARNLSNLYLAKHATEQQARKIRFILGYLEMQSGNLDVAGQEILASQQKLESISLTARDKLMNKNKIRFEDLLYLQNIAESKISTPALLDEALKLFADLIQIQVKLDQSQGNLRNLLHTLGSASNLQVKPEWSRQADQLQVIAKELLETSHKIVGVERFLWENQISTSDKQFLESSQNRRTSLMTTGAVMRRESNPWATLGNLYQLSITLAKYQHKLYKMKSQLSTASYIEKDDINLVQRIESLQKKFDTIYEKTKSALDLVRDHRVNELFAESPHFSYYKYFKLYSSSVVEEIQIFEEVRNVQAELTNRLLAKDLTQFWKHWKFLMNNLTQQYENMSKNIYSEVNDILRELDLYDQKQKKFQDLHNQYKNSLEQKLARVSPIIYNHYKNAISGKLSTHYKLEADLEKLKFNELKSKEQGVVEKYKLEKQFIDDQMKDLQHGVIWQ